ncbi:acyl-CoA thioesterase [Paenibacillus sp. GCM10027629]|uniref:acyl-CoA thioesterase n=1 Tax=Paenibacillus sp. GCM10027629 TaxID=3273414 RepID=UPI003625B2EB
MYSTVWEFKVRFADTDAAGIVYYPNFYKWMDQATHEMFESIHYPTNKLLSEQKGIPLVEAHCQFRRPLLCSDMIRIVSNIEEVRNKVVKIRHTFFRAEELVAEGYEIRAWVSMLDGVLKAQPLPEELRHLLISSAGSDH